MDFIGRDQNMKIEVNVSQIGTVTDFVVERGTLVCVYVIDIFL